MMLAELHTLCALYKSPYSQWESHLKILFFLSKQGVRLEALSFVRRAFSLLMKKKYALFVHLKTVEDFEQSESVLKIALIVTYFNSMRDYEE